jgi:hypothetical protein
MPANTTKVGFIIHGKASSFGNEGYDHVCIYVLLHKKDLAPDDGGICNANYGRQKLQKQENCSSTSIPYACSDTHKSCSPQ